MATRDLDNRRSVTQVVAENSQNIMTSAAEFGLKSIEDSQKAKITESLSSATLDLNTMKSQFQTEFESNPEEAFDEYKTRRKGILDSYGQNIPAIFKRDWQMNVRQMEQRDNLTYQSWAVKQSRVNTVNSINKSIKNNLSLAMSDGQRYGEAEESEIEAYINHQASRSQLEQFGATSLGAETTDQLLADYDDDYLKMFASGVMETNPQKALQLIESDMFKSSVADPLAYKEMKDAAEARVLKLAETTTQKQILGALKNENSTLARSLEKPLSYPEVMEATKSMNPAARSYFMKINGYTKSDGSKASPKLSDSQKAETKAALYDTLVQLSRSEDLDTATVAEFQNQIYAAMDSDALTQKEGLSFIEQITMPLVERKEESLSRYGQSNWFSDSTGFAGIQEFYEDSIEIKPAEGEEQVGQTSRAINAVNKSKLYDYYMSSLEAIGHSYKDPNHPNGIAIAEMDTLNSTQREKIFSQAQTEAQKLYLQDKHPTLRSLPDVPNLVYSNGTLIQGMAGSRGLNADITAAPKFQMMRDPVTGVYYRRYENGTVEEVQNGQR